MVVAELFSNTKAAEDQVQNVIGCGFAGDGVQGTQRAVKINHDHFVGNSALHSFTGGADGSTPFAPLVRDKAGNLYGTTASGGSFRNGTVFKVDATGNETVLHSFTGLDGSSPLGGLARDKAGNLYGTTISGDSSRHFGTYMVGRRARSPAASSRCSRLAVR